jgi:hypothetical protein
MTMSAYPFINQCEWTTEKGAKCKRFPRYQLANEGLGKSYLCRIHAKRFRGMPNLVVVKNRD